MDKIRVIKLLVYEGPRDVLEKHLEGTITGTKRIPATKSKEGYSITAFSLCQFPEILETISKEGEENAE